MNLREKQLQEALKRIEMLELHPNVAKELEKESKLNASEHMGALFWLKEVRRKSSVRLRINMVSLYTMLSGRTRRWECFYLSCMFHLLKKNGRWKEQI